MSKCGLEIIMCDQGLAEVFPPLGIHSILHPAAKAQTARLSPGSACAEPKKYTTGPAYLTTYDEKSIAIQIYLHVVRITVHVDKSQFHQPFRLRDFLHPSFMLGFNRFTVAEP